MSKRTIILIPLIGAMILGSMAVTASARTSGAQCSVSPDPVSSAGALTVSGKAGHNGDWVNAYVYYSDGYWELLGGSIEGGGKFSLAGYAEETHTSLWGPFYPASTGPASVEIYVGTASKNLGVVATCKFRVN